MNPYLIIAAGVAAVSLAVGGFTFGVKYARGQQARTEQLIAQVRDEAALGAAAEIAKIDIRHTTIRQTIEGTVREVPVYRDCVNDPAVERLLDDARADRDPEPAGGGGVPGTGTGEP